MKITRKEIAYIKELIWLDNKDDLLYQKLKLAADDLNVTSIKIEDSPLETQFVAANKIQASDKLVIDGTAIPIVFIKRNAPERYLLEYKADLVGSVIIYCSNNRPAYYYAWTEQIEIIKRK